MTETTLSEQISDGFISYRRDDNTSFRNVVDRLHEDIGNTYEARTGRVLNLFLDRESIGWGEDWRKKIRTSVQTATVFIPIVTMRYFTSQACRDELFAFHEAAKNLGVTELLLPIILMGAENITKDDDRPEVQLIESLNYKNIEPAFRAGFDSPEWLQTIDRIVADLIEGLKAAEEALSAEDAREAASAARPERPVEEDNDEELAEEDILEVSSMTLEFEAITDLTEKANEGVVRLGEVASLILEGVDFERMPPKQVNAHMFKVAQAFKAPAKQLEADGKALEERITATDARLRRLVSELKAIDNDNAQEFLKGLITGFGESAEIEEVGAQMESLIGEMKFASTMSVAIRNALQPAIRGIRSVQTAASTFSGWQNLT